MEGGFAEVWKERKGIEIHSSDQEPIGTKVKKEIRSVIDFFLDNFIQLSGQNPVSSPSRYAALQMLCYY